MSNVVSPASNPIGPLVEADESFCHQVIDSFACVGSSDLSWTEKVCAMAMARDGSLQIGFGPLRRRRRIAAAAASPQHQHREQQNQAEDRWKSHHDLPSARRRQELGSHLIQGARGSCARETRGPLGPLNVSRSQVAVVVPGSETSLTPERAQQEFCRLSRLDVAKLVPVTNIHCKSIT